MYISTLFCNGGRAVKNMLQYGGALLLACLCSSYAAHAAGTMATEYDYVWPYHNGVAQVEINEKYGLINEASELILPVEYDRIAHMHDAGMYVEKDGLIGLLSDTGALVLEPSFTFFPAEQIGRAHV